MARCRVRLPSSPPAREDDVKRFPRRLLPGLEDEEKQTKRLPAKDGLLKRRCCPPAGGREGRTLVTSTDPASVLNPTPSPVGAEL